MFRRVVLPVLFVLLATVVSDVVCSSPPPPLSLSPSPPPPLSLSSPLPFSSPLHSPVPTPVALAAPRLVSRQPLQYRLRERRPTIHLVFDQAMDAQSLAAALSVEPPVRFRLRCKGVDAYVTVLEPLTPGVQYEFHLAASATDVNGLPLAFEPAWSYQMEDLIAGQDWPARRGDRSTPLSIRFNYPMDMESVQRALAIQPAIEGDLKWNERRTIVTLTPQAPLPNETEYTVHFEAGLRDANGDELPPPAPLRFTTPPPILATQPRADQDVRPATAIKVTFDRLMDPQSTAAAFQITPPVPGQIEWRETTLVFRPEQGYLQEYTTYTVTLTASAVDDDGNPILREDYAWSFTTGQAQDVANFGWGPNGQVVDAEGRRAVQFGLFQEAVSTTLRFELYRLSLEQFLDRYSSGFKGVAGSENRPISTQGTGLARTWQVEAPQAVAYGTVQGTIIPGDVLPGLYVLNLEAGHLNDQLILLLTRNVVTLKQAEGQIVAWVTDVDGSSKVGVEVSVYARDGQLLSRGLTGRDGVYRTAVARDPQPLIVVARDGDDLTATGLSNEWLSTQNPWWGWWAPAPAALDYAVYAYTDRPIYRPGQTVYFKGIVRRDEDAVLSMPPEGTPVTVRIRDARDNVVQTLALATGRFGTLDGEFHLAEGAMLGTYAVECVVNGESHRQAFKVQDYRKPDYQVSVTPDAAQYVVGETMRVSVDSRYFFGEPVPNARLVVRQYELVERYWWDEAADGEYDWYQSSQPTISGVTDANGRFTFTLKAALGAYSDRYDYFAWQHNLRQTTWGIEVTVDDGSHQTVSSFATVKVFSAAGKLSLDTGGAFKTPGQPFTVRAGVVTLSGAPLSGRAMRLLLRRYDAASGDYRIVVQSASMTTGDDGEASTPFTVEKPGYYQLYLSTTDPLGNALEYQAWLSVFSDAASWMGDGGGDLRIAAERERYAPGETARLIVESSFSGPALVTFERGTVRRTRLVQLSAPLTVLEVPIQADDAPNVFVTVNAWQEQDTSPAAGSGDFSRPDSRLRTASVELQVPVSDKALHVTITPDRRGTGLEEPVLGTWEEPVLGTWASRRWAGYAPRERATFTVRVTNERGDPVSAELSLALVDEAIYGLSEELAGPILDAFYCAREHIVRTYDGMALMRYIPCNCGGGEGGGGGDLAANPRSDFPDTAAWFPALTTDWNGEATVTVVMPDSLTRWRLTARAVTADTQVGEGLAYVMTQQEIVVRPILPRGLTVGDRVEMAAMVHNYGERSQDVAVSIASDGLEIEGVLTQTVRLAPGEQRIVRWRAEAARAGEAQVTVRADAGQVGDAVRLPLPIYPLAVPDVTTQVGQFSGEFTTTVFLPTQALGLSTVKIELARSIAGSLLTGLEYLTGYPFGCVEQTMSKALPNAVVGRAFYQLGIGNPTLQADLPPKIAASVQRLYGFQHNDGGWGWWYDDSSHDYQTAWVVFGLTVTAQAGYEVDPAVIERGVAWLKEHLGGMDRRTRAYALYSMASAGVGELEATRALAREAGDLDTFSQAALALALHEMGAQSEAEQMLHVLERSAVVVEGAVYWPNAPDDGHYNGKTMASTTRSTALALSAFVHVEPKHELEPGIVRWLMGQRRQEGWGSTNETSFTVLALTDHLLAVESATSDTTYRVSLNGQVLASGLLGRGEPAVSMEIPASQLVRGPNRLRIEQGGDGHLYYVIASRVYLPEEAIAAAGGVTVSRTFLDGETGRPITSTVAGALVQVRLEVTLPRDGFYVIVEDRLPGGLEALNEGLNTTSHEASACEEPRYYWAEYGYNNKEVRGERVSFFITEMGAGQHTLTYLARATHAGEFVAMPAEVYAMYDATVWGRSGSERFVVGRESR